MEWVRKHALIAAVITGILLGSTAVFISLQGQVRTSLLPDNLARQVTNYTPYFFFHDIPAGYTLDETQASYSNGVLVLPLKKPDKAPIVITQQRLPEDLNQATLQENGEKIKGAAQPATIANVEGRFVGTMIDAERGVLILLNTTGTAKSDMTSMLQNLEPIR